MTEEEEFEFRLRFEQESKQEISEPEKVDHLSRAKELTEFDIPSGKPLIDMASIGIQSLLPEGIREKLLDIRNNIAETLGIEEPFPTGGYSEEEKQKLQVMLNDPSTQFAIGAASSAMNILEKISPDFEEQMKGADLGESSFQTGGKFLDPVLLGVGKLANVISPYAKMTGSGFKEGAKAFLKNVTTGTVAGGTAGAVSPDMTVGEGATFGGAASVGIPAVIGGGGKLIKEGQKILHPSVGKLARTVGGDKSDELAEALLRAKKGQSAGQATTDVGSAEFAGLQKISDKLQPTLAVNIKAQQIAKRQNMLERVKPDLTQSIEARKTVTDPMRTSSLEAANVAGQKGTELSGRIAQKEDSIINILKDRWQLATTGNQQNMMAALPANRSAKPKVMEALAKQKGLSGDDLRYDPHITPPKGAGNVKGYPSVPPRYSPHRAISNTVDDAVDDIKVIESQRKSEKEFLQYQLDSIDSHGLKSLNSQQLASNVNKTFSQPGIRVSDVVEDAGIYINDKLQKFTKQDGTIDARDLYGIRKDIGKVIKSFQKARGVYDKDIASSLQRKIQLSIDDSIEQAGGTDWKNYIKKYSELSKPIEQSKIIESMQGTLKGPGGEERAKPFLNLMGKEESLYKKGTDYPGFKPGELDKTLAPRQRSVSKIVERELERDIKQSNLAKAGVSKAGEELGFETSAPELPNWLNPKVTLTKSIMKRLYGLGGKRTTDELSKMMIENPREVGKLMKEAKGDPEVIHALLKSRYPQVFGGLTGEQ